MDTKRQIFKKAFLEAGTQKSVLLASTFRSGSTYVGDLLRFNGLAGLDLEKFNKFWPLIQAPDAEFLQALQAIAQTTEDGVFTSKIMWPHRNHLALCLGIDRKHSYLFREFFPDAKWIFVHRENKVKQSISLWRAKCSGRWHVKKTETEPQLDYSYKQIKACYNEIVAHDQLWMDFFKQSGIDPLVVRYEKFLAKTESSLKTILDFVGSHRTRPLDFSIENELERQTDGMSAIYYDRYMEDAYKGN